MSFVGTGNGLSLRIEHPCISVNASKISTARPCLIDTRVICGFCAKELEDQDGGGMGELREARGRGRMSEVSGVFGGSTPARAEMIPSDREAITGNVKWDLLEQGNWSK